VGIHPTPESKQQSTEWCHTHCPMKNKVKISTSAKKIMVTVFWDRKRALKIDFILHRSPLTLRHIVKHWKGLDMQFRTEDERCWHEASAYWTTT
jgi:hypothetical protein